MAAKTECDRNECKKVFDSMQEGSSCISIIVYGKVENDRGIYANYDFCPKCTDAIDECLEAILNAKD